MKSRMSKLAFGASFFWAFAVGYGTAFTTGTAFCRSPFLATVAPVLFGGCTGVTGIFVLLASGALVGGLARGHVLRNSGA